jgi:hypothetical protein
LRAAEQIVEVARRFGDPDLLAQGLVCQGRLLMYSGRVPEGLALLDEAMVGVAAGELSPIFAGNVYCAMIEGCQEVQDFARASAWTAALTRWCADRRRARFERVRRRTADPWRVPVGRDGL